MPIIPDFEAYRGGEHRPSTASPNSAGLVAEANAKLGASIGAAAEDLNDLQVKLRKARNEGARNDAAMIAGREFDDFPAYRRANADDSKWQPELQARRDRAASEVAKLKVSDEVKKELLKQVDERFKAAEKENGNAALRETARRARQSATGNVERLVAAGDHDGALEVVRRGREEDIFSEAEAEADTRALLAGKEQHAKMQRGAQLLEEMKDDPLGVIARLEAEEGEGDLEEMVRTGTLRDGRDLLARRREDEYRTLAGAIAKREVTEQQLEDLPEYLADGSRQSLLAHARRATPPDAGELRAGWKLLEGVSKAFGRWSDGSLEDAGYMESYAVARDGIQATVPPGWKGRMLSALQAFAPEQVIDAGAAGLAGLAQVRERKRIEIRLQGLARQAREQGLMADEDETMTDLMVWLDGEKSPAMPQALERFRETIGGRLSGSIARDLAAVLPGSPRAFFPPRLAGDLNLTGGAEHGTGDA